MRRPSKEASRVEERSREVLETPTQAAAINIREVKEVIRNEYFVDILGGLEVQEQDQ